METVNTVLACILVVFAAVRMANIPKAAGLMCKNKDVAAGKMALMILVLAAEVVWCFVAASVLYSNPL